MILEYADPFEVAAGLHWYCADYHEGLWSRRYRILKRLGYRPALNERGPRPGDAQETYDALRVGEITLEEAEARAAETP